MSALPVDTPHGVIPTVQPSLITTPVITPPVMTPPVLTPPPSTQMNIVSQASNNGPPTSGYFSNSILDFQNMITPMGPFSLAGQTTQTPVKTSMENVSEEPLQHKNDMEMAVGGDVTRQQQFRWSNGMDFKKENTPPYWSVKESQNMNFLSESFLNCEDKIPEEFQKKPQTLKTEVNKERCNSAIDNQNYVESIKNYANENEAKDQLELQMGQHDVEGFTEQRWRAWARYLAHNMLNRSSPTEQQKLSPIPPEPPSSVDMKSRSEDKGVVTPPDEKCHNSLWCKRPPSFSDDIINQKIAKITEKCKSSVEIREINHNRTNNLNIFCQNKNNFPSVNQDINQDSGQELNNELGRKLNINISQNANREAPRPFNHGIPCNLNQDLVRGLARDLNRDLSRDIKRQLNRESNCAVISRDLHRELGLDLRYRPHPENDPSPCQQSK